MSEDDEAKTMWCSSWVPNTLRGTLLTAEQSPTGALEWEGIIIGSYYAVILGMVILAMIKGLSDQARYYRGFIGEFECWAMDAEYHLKGRAMRQKLLDQLQKRPDSPFEPPNPTD